MSLFISFVPVNVSAEKLTQYFDDMFGANVFVQLGPVRTNSYNIRYKTARIRVVEETRQLAHFIREIKTHNSSTFTAEKTDYTVRLGEQDFVAPTTSGFKARIV